MILKFEKTLYKVKRNSYKQPYISKQSSLDTIQNKLNINMRILKTFIYEEIKF